MNEKTKYYYNDLPEDYVKDYEIDAKSTKFTIIYGLIVNLALTAGVIAICLVAVNFSFSNLMEYRKNEPIFFIVSLLVFLLMLFVYLILHELTHGLFYKIFTHEKLTLGVTLTVAYCGIPTIYSKKWPMFITTLAPFFTFILVFGIPLFFINNILIYLLCSIMLGVHVGGCIGDLYGATILLFKYHGKAVLVNDTGPKQTFYIKK